MSYELSKEVLRNALWTASENMPLTELQNVVKETLHSMCLEYSEIAMDYAKYEDAFDRKELSADEDAKQIDDAQRYRDLKS